MLKKHKLGKLTTILLLTLKKLNTPPEIRLDN